MKLKITDRGQEFIQNILAIEPFHGSCPDDCSDHKVNILLYQWEKEAENYEFDFMKNEFKFFLNICNVYQDGRACPGPDRINVVKKLTNDDWRTDMSIVMNGLRYGCIQLEEKDLERMAP